MKISIFIFVFSLISFHFGFAQIVNPLFRNDSLLAQVTLPFSLLNAQSQALPIYNLELTSGGPNCKAIIDPNIKNNFLVKCSAAGTFSIDVFYESGSNILKISYGTITVNSMSGAVLNPGNENQNQFTKGQTAFNENCIKCHGTAYSLQNRSASKIKSAISTISSMKNELATLSEEDIKLISYYLGNLE